MSKNEQCRICMEDNPAVLEEHHIIPKRYGAGDGEENLVTLCANCHTAIEEIYDNEVWERINLTPSWNTDGPSALEHVFKRASLISTLNELKKGVEMKIDGDVDYHDLKNADYLECSDKKTAYLLGHYQAYESFGVSLLRDDADVIVEDQSVHELEISADD